MNPVEEFLMKKAAMSPEVKAALTLGAISAGTTAVAAVGTSQLQDGIQSAQDAVSKSIAFKRMMNDNPKLQKMEGKRARRYFNTLYHTAPEVAKDPFSAGSWVQKVDDYDYVDPQSLNTLAQTGAKLRERKTQNMMPAFQLAQGAVQTGIGEYGRQQDMSIRKSQDDARRAFEEKKFKYQKRKDFVGGAGKAVGWAGRELGRTRERMEDMSIKERHRTEDWGRGIQDEKRRADARYQENAQKQEYEANKEMRTAKQKEWDALYGHKSQSPVSRDQYYLQGSGFPYPASTGRSFKVSPGYGGTTNKPPDPKDYTLPPGYDNKTGKATSQVPSMMDALKKMFGR